MDLLRNVLEPDVLFDFRHSAVLVRDVGLHVQHLLPRVERVAGVREKLDVPGQWLAGGAGRLAEDARRPHPGEGRDSRRPRRGPESTTRR